MKKWILLFLFLLFNAYSTLSAQVENGEIIVISDRVGKEIDKAESNKFNLFQNIEGYHSAIIYELPDSTYILQIKSIDKKTGEIKITDTPHLLKTIEKTRDYIDRFEEIQAKRNDDENKMTFVISNRVGLEIDRDSSNRRWPSW